MEMTAEVIGRDEELASVYAVLDRTASGPAALVLEGEAGIGKSTLWLAGVEAARERGLLVLSARPAEAERGLAHAGLGDLFEAVLDDVLPALSPPRRRALKVALLVEEAGEVADPRTLGVAVRSALKVLAAEGPFVLAIDDVQWLDASSGSALAFALRRPEANVRLLLARRLEEGVLTSELEKALDPDRVGRLRVGPLSLGALHRLLQQRLDRIFPRPTLLRLHEASGGTRSSRSSSPARSVRMAGPATRQSCFMFPRHWKGSSRPGSTSFRPRPAERCCSSRRRGARRARFSRPQESRRTRSSRRSPHT